MIDLDDLQALRRNDPSGMGERIAELPWQCKKAWEIVEEQRFPPHYGQAENVVILGMGGSAIGGDLLRTLVKDICPIPILVNRDYNLPHFVGPDTLVIASSYSGDTEETLNAFQEAKTQGAKVLAITTDGILAESAKNLVTFSYLSPPRAALGFSLVLLWGVLTRLGYIPALDLEETVEVLGSATPSWREKSPTSQNQAKQLALALHGKVPIIYGAQHLAAVARRWKTQFNENSKSFAFFDTLPELNHNTVEAFGHPQELVDRGVILLLTSHLYHPRNIVRFQVTQEIIAQNGIPHQRVEVQGETPLSQALWTVHLGDYVSLYLAALRGVDPSSGESIAYLKEQLAQV